jgi:16S rRNA (cytidine1402-2'-O)-methyltransferase
MPDETSPADRFVDLARSFQDRELAPGLYIVATPIGNLEDITLRALRVLQQADLIACEDTRQTQKLLNYFGIRKPAVSYHAHNEAERGRQLLERLQEGAKIALVSDAGMPGISDPGGVVIAAAIKAGVPVTPVPGPSALISALVASGLSTESFRFLSFLPAKSGARRTLLEQIKTASETLVFYEAPHRIADALKDIAAILGPQRHVVIARELTKVHEEFLRGSAEDVLKKLVSRAGEIKGEITLLISGYQPEAQLYVSAEKRDISSRIAQLIRDGSDEKAALKTAAKEFGLSKSEAYREWQRRKS